MTPYQGALEIHPNYSKNISFIDYDDIIFLVSFASLD